MALSFTLCMQTPLNSGVCITVLVVTLLQSCSASLRFCICCRAFDLREQPVETPMDIFQVDRSLLRSLESCAEEAIGGSDWSQKLDPVLLTNLGRYRKYNPGSLRDLLRVIRNKHNHFREMPEHLQEKLGPLPEAFLRCGVCKLSLRVFFSNLDA